MVYSAKIVDQGIVTWSSMISSLSSLEVQLRTTHGIPAKGQSVDGSRRRAQRAHAKWAHMPHEHMLYSRLPRRQVANVEAGFGRVADL